MAAYTEITTATTESANRNDGQVMPNGVLWEESTGSGGGSGRSSGSPSNSQIIPAIPPAPKLSRIRIHLRYRRTANFARSMYPIHQRYHICSSAA